MSPRIPALSIRQPWAWAILHYGKDVENRTWPTKHRGTLYVHAGRAIDRRAVGMLTDIGVPVPEHLPTGGLLGAVHVGGLHHDHADLCWCDCSPWAEAGAWHWVLTDPRPFTELVPCPGRLGLFYPPAEVVTP